VEPVERPVWRRGLVFLVAGLLSWLLIGMLLVWLLAR
jgi:hypothetical protein